MTRPNESTDHDQLVDRLNQLQNTYEDFQAQDLRLNMARGKPSAEQLDLSMPMLSAITSLQDCVSADGTDCRNYGVIDGLPETKQLMSGMLDDNPENIIIFGNSSLNVMYDTVARCLDFGTGGSCPWCTFDTIKWLCPVPGYDRHFAICESFGIEMIPIPMKNTGPDIQQVQKLVAEDERVKGIWCVPKYANPSGITYSDEVVRALAHMECAAEDFRIFWDNAYCVHHLFDEPDEQDRVLDIGAACRQAGNPNRYFKFASTSKITFPGAGISGMASSPKNISEIKTQLSAQTIGYDKLNQLRHVKFLRDSEGIADHMSKHAAILRPKFQLVLDKLAAGLSDVKGCTWTEPRGGYFVLLNAPNGTAKRVVELAHDAGVVLTKAGATWPLGDDPYDSDIRIAPTLPPLSELDTAMDVLVCCVQIAAIEKQLQA